MALEVKQVLQQRLVVAPNVSLALKILRIPTLELQAFLQTQLEGNPLLEMDEPHDGADDPSEPPEADERPGPVLPDEEWLSHWGNATALNGFDADHDATQGFLDQRLITRQSLHDSLRTQLGCQRLPEQERERVEVLINHLDDSGYLKEPLEALAEELDLGLEETAATLHVIQGFDPPGVGARDLRECLMIQLAQRGATDGLAYRILKDHFAQFVQRHFSHLARATGSSSEQVAAAAQEVTRLNPRPGCAFADNLPPSITPDLIIHQRNGHYDVELNDQDVPRVRLSRCYHRMLRNSDTSSEAREFLANKLRQANWVIKAIQERHTTILSIARCLISLQRDFLEQGPQALKPLTQAQVAGLIGRNPSTVSRAIAGKTISTPFGTFRLEELFPSGVPQANGNGRVSDEEIKSELKRLIAAEEPAHPLSDAALADRLKEREISVARRTIAKYRASLKILPAHLRRHHP